MNPTNYEVFVYGFYFALGGAASGAIVAMGMTIFTCLAGLLMGYLQKDAQ